MSLLNDVPPLLIIVVVFQLAVFSGLVALGFAREWAQRLEISFSRRARRLFWALFYLCVGIGGWYKLQLAVENIGGRAKIEPIETNEGFLALTVGFGTFLCGSYLVRLIAKRRGWRW